MQTRLAFSLMLAGLLLCACANIEKQSPLIYEGDSQNDVMALIGTPEGRQQKGLNEAWQYCQTKAEFGYHNYTIIWFYRGKVTGVNSYTNSHPSSSCVTEIQPAQWDKAPNNPIELRLH